MEIIFHIGMGKTGTSSIQAALLQSKSELEKSGIEYLGMWLSLIDISYRGYAGFDMFASRSEHEIQEDAVKLYENLKLRKFDKFIYSNESIFANIHAFSPFFKKLKELGVSVKVIIYVRPMRDWLPSAFIQWNSYHKTHSGEVQSFSQKGRDLAALYGNITCWLDELPDNVALSRFSKGENIITDFSKIIGVNLMSAEDRVWERIEDTEAVLRSIFNDRVEEPALPQLYEQAMKLQRGGEVRSIEEFSRTSLDFSCIGEILDEFEGVFEEIKQRTGLEVSGKENHVTPPPPDYEEIRRRMMDYLVEISIKQSLRIQRLEKIIEDKFG